MVRLRKQTKQTATHVDCRMSFKRAPFIFHRDSPQNRHYTSTLENGRLASGEPIHITYTCQRRFRESTRQIDAATRHIVRLILDDRLFTANASCSPSELVETLFNAIREFHFTTALLASQRRSVTYMYMQAVAWFD